MAKAELSQVVEPKCRRLAEQLHFELVDVCLEKETTGRYLRIYIDKPEGISLDDCEQYHRAIQPMVENYDYDFLEVSSPGVDRPLKKDRDFERSIGMEIEVHLFKAMNGTKDLNGILSDFDKENFTIQCGEEAVTVPRRAASMVRPVVDMEGVENVDLTGDDDAGSMIASEETEEE